MSFSVLSFGGGVNSTALLLHLLDTEQPLDLVLFADTGGELPRTYEHVEEVQRWCDAHGLRFVRVSNGSDANGWSLEENCLRRHELPSLAYGFKGCSVKWKRQPMDRHIRDNEPEAVAVWASGGLVNRYIGIDAGEAHRKQLPPDNRYVYRYPLIEAGIDRDGCVALIKRHGLSVPGKSSCFFCPAMRKSEILALPEEYKQRAIAIERNAVTHTVAGLGRSWKWETLIGSPSTPTLPFQSESPCDCMDGEEEAPGR